MTNIPEAPDGPAPDDPSSAAAVIESLQAFAAPSPDGRSLARAYLAEVEPFTTTTALRLVAQQLGIADPPRFRADLVAEIALAIDAGTAS